MKTLDIAAAPSHPHEAVMYKRKCIMAVKSYKYIMALCKVQQLMKDSWKSVGLDRGKGWQIGAVIQTLHFEGVICENSDVVDMTK